jgi:serine/threonine protein kinase
MHDDDPLEDLVDRWHDAETTGQSLTPEDICRDTPLHLPEFQRVLTLLRQFEALRSDDGASTVERPPAQSTTLPDSPETHERYAVRPSALPVIGAKFDGYRIVVELGRGGMGCVFRATNLALRRDEALKIMLPEVASKPLARERFLREAQAMAAVRHDHVVEIYHVREIEGVPYLAMPLLEGETLATRLKRDRTLPAPEVVRIGLQMAEGLAAAHGRGLIHRDIKPGNVWLEARTNRVKLLDFGLVREEGSASDLTGSGAILGTPAYMSPEQVNGETLDARSDLFSVGSVLYECTTGRKAFSGPTISAVLSAVVQKEPPAAQVVNSLVSAPLSDLLRALLQKDPTQRPATAEELALRLRALANSSPESDRDTMTTTKEFTEPRRLWPWLMAVGCVLGLSLIACTGVYKLLYTNRPGERRAEAKVTSPVTTISSVTGPTSSPVTPHLVEPLRVLKIDVRHYKRIGPKEAEYRGLIGERSFAATLGDQVEIEARLSRPAYSYLIAYNPDGTSELCFPNPAEAPPWTDRPHYPFLDRDKQFGLTDGAGLMVFTVVASDTPLPPYKEWSSQNRPVWKHAEGTLGEVWWDGGNLLDTLTPNGPVSTARGTGAEALGRSGAIMRLSDSLKQDKPDIAVASIGFVVQKR